LAQIKNKDIEMLKKVLASVVLAVGFANAGAILPNDELQLGLLAQNARAKMIVLANMHLKGDQKKKFGDLYDEYQKELVKLRVKRVNIIKDYAKNFKDMNDKNADKILSEWMQTQKDELAIKEKYVEKFKKILPSSLVLRFYQIENRLNIRREANIASMLPLAIPDQNSKKIKK
jgi:hypothetical protein